MSSMYGVYGVGAITILIYLGLVALSFFVTYLIIKTAVKNGIRDSVLPGALREAVQQMNQRPAHENKEAPLSNAGFVPIQPSPISQPEAVQASCPACGSSNNTNATFCRHCGNALR